MTRPRCGNDPRAQLTDDDRRAVADFRAYLADRAALRDRIAEAIARRDGHDWGPGKDSLPSRVIERYTHLADAVLAVLPEPADQAAELTAEEARALADDLGLQLYRAQDALAFVAECCTIAEREQRAITTSDVREWLKGAQCGRQLATGLRRMADETPAAETTAYKAARYGMTPEEYRAHRHLAAVRQIRAALPGLYATTGLRVEASLTEPADGARQDGARP